MLMKLAHKTTVCFVVDLYAGHIERVLRRHQYANKYELTGNGTALCCATLLNSHLRRFVYNFPFADRILKKVMQKRRMGSLVLLFPTVN